MKLINSLLVPLDIAGDYSSVLRAGVTCAGHLKSRLVLYHAFPNPISDEKKAFLEKELTREASDVFSDLKLGLTEIAAHVEYEKLPEGKTFRSLLSDSEMVMVGGGSNPENKGKKDKLLSIIDDFTQPVLVIPHHSGLRKPSRILFCSSYRNMSSNDPLKVLKYLAGVCGAKVRIAHVKTHDGSPKGDHIDRSRFEGKYFEPDVPYSYKLIRNSDVVDGINEYIERKGDNDMVVMIRRKHKVIDKIFGPNFTHQMLREARLPLLILKENQLN